MQHSRLTFRSVNVRPVLVPLTRPVVSRVGHFDLWPLILIDLQTEEGIVGRSYLEPYLKDAARYIVPAVHDLARGRRSGRSTTSRARARHSTWSAMKGCR